MTDKIKKAIGVLEVNKLISSTQTEFCESVDLAIEALEKQIPKKLIVKENQFFDCITGYSCPTCGNLLIGRARKYENSYCHDCGQKLEWSDVKCQRIN